MIIIYIMTPLFAAFAFLFARRIGSAVRKGTAEVSGVEYQRTVDRFFFHGTIAIWAAFAAISAAAAAVGISLIVVSIISPGSF